MELCDGAVQGLGGGAASQLKLHLFRWRAVVVGDDGSELLSMEGSVLDGGVAEPVRRGGREGGREGEREGGRGGGGEGERGGRERGREGREGGREGGRETKHVKILVKCKVSVKIEVQIQVNSSACTISFCVYTLHVHVRAVCTVAEITSSLEWIKACTRHNHGY